MSDDAALRRVLPYQPDGFGLGKAALRLGLSQTYQESRDAASDVACG